jgi:hypothetical protein
MDGCGGLGDRSYWRVWRLRSPNKRSRGRRGGRPGLASDDRLLLLQKWPPLLLFRPREAQLPRLEERFRPLLIPPAAAEARQAAGSPELWVGKHAG